MANRQTIGDATVDGPQLKQPEPGSGTPGPAHDGREYWRRRALRAERALLELSEAIATVATTGRKSSPPPALGST